MARGKKNFYKNPVIDCYIGKKWGSCTREQKGGKTLGNDGSRKQGGRTIGNSFSMESGGGEIHINIDGTAAGRSESERSDCPCENRDDAAGRITTTTEDVGGGKEKS